jgi:hypothetical protein
MNVKERKKELAVKYGSQCYVCRKPFGKGFLFHHKWYDGTEPSYNNKNEYYEHVFKQIQNNPNQFLLLCKVHHYFVEWGKRISTEKFKRYNKAVRMSKQ